MLVKMNVVFIAFSFIYLLTSVETKSISKRGVDVAKLMNRDTHAETSKNHPELFKARYAGKELDAGYQSPTVLGKFYKDLPAINEHYKEKNDVGDLDKAEMNQQALQKKSEMIEHFRKILKDARQKMKDLRVNTKKGEYEVNNNIEYKSPGQEMYRPKDQQPENYKPENVNINKNYEGTPTNSMNVNVNTKYNENYGNMKNNMNVNYENNMKGSTYDENMGNTNEQYLNKMKDVVDTYDNYENKNVVNGPNVDKMKQNKNDTYGNKMEGYSVGHNIKATAYDNYENKGNGNVQYENKMKENKYEKYGKQVEGYSYKNNMKENADEKYGHAMKGNTNEKYGNSMQGNTKEQYVNNMKGYNNDQYENKLMENTYGGYETRMNANPNENLHKSHVKNYGTFDNQNKMNYDAYNKVVTDNSYNIEQQNMYHEPKREYYSQLEPNKIDVYQKKEMFDSAYNKGRLDDPDYLLGNPKEKTDDILSKKVIPVSSISTDDNQMAKSLSEKSASTTDNEDQRKKVNDDKPVAEKTTVGDHLSTTTLSTQMIEPNNEQRTNAPNTDSPLIVQPKDLYNDDTTQLAIVGASNIVENDAKFQENSENNHGEQMEQLLYIRDEVGKIRHLMQIFKEHQTQQKSNRTVQFNPEEMRKIEKILKSMEVKNQVMVPEIPNSVLGDPLETMTGDSDISDEIKNLKVTVRTFDEKLNTMIIKEGEVDKVGEQLQKHEEEIENMKQFLDKLIKMNEMNRPITQKKEIQESIEQLRVMAKNFEPVENRDFIVAASNDGKQRSAFESNIEENLRKIEERLNSLKDEKSDSEPETKVADDVTELLSIFDKITKADEKTDDSKVNKKLKKLEKELRVIEDENKRVKQEIKLAKIQSELESLKETREEKITKSKTLKKASDEQLLAEIEKMKAKITNLNSKPSERQLPENNVTAELKKLQEEIARLMPKGESAVVEPKQNIQDLFSDLITPPTPAQVNDQTSNQQFKSNIFQNNYERPTIPQGVQAGIASNNPIPYPQINTISSQSISAGQSISAPDASFQTEFVKNIPIPPFTQNSMPTKIVYQMPFCIHPLYGQSGNAGHIGQTSSSALVSNQYGDFSNANAGSFGESTSNQQVNTYSKNLGVIPQNRNEFSTHQFSSVSNNNNNANENNQMAVYQNEPIADFSKNTAANFQQQDMQQSGINNYQAPMHSTDFSNHNSNGNPQQTYHPDSPMPSKQYPVENPPNMKPAYSHYPVHNQGMSPQKYPHFQEGSEDDYREKRSDYPILGHPHLLEPPTPLKYDPKIPVTPYLPPTATKLDPLTHLPVVDYKSVLEKYANDNLEKLKEQITNLEHQINHYKTDQYSDVAEQNINNLESLLDGYIDTGDDDSGEEEESEKPRFKREVHDKEWIQNAQERLREIKSKISKIKDPKQQKKSIFILEQLEKELNEMKVEPSTTTEKVTKTESTTTESTTIESTSTHLHSTTTEAQPKKENSANAANLNLLLTEVEKIRRKLRTSLSSEPASKGTIENGSNTTTLNSSDAKKVADSLKELQSDLKVELDMIQDKLKDLTPESRVQTNKIPNVEKEQRDQNDDLFSEIEKFKEELREHDLDKNAVESKTSDDAIIENNKTEPKKNPSKNNMIMELEKIKKDLETLTPNVKPKTKSRDEKQFQRDLKKDLDMIEDKVKGLTTESITQINEIPNDEKMQRDQNDEQSDLFSEIERFKEELRKRDFGKNAAELKTSDDEIIENNKTEPKKNPSKNDMIMELEKIKNGLKKLTPNVKSETKSKDEKQSIQFPEAINNSPKNEKSPNKKHGIKTNEEFPNKESGVKKFHEQAKTHSNKTHDQNIPESRGDDILINLNDRSKNLDSTGTTEVTTVLTTTAPSITELQELTTIAMKKYIIRIKPKHRASQTSNQTVPEQESRQLPADETTDLTTETPPVTVYNNNPPIAPFIPINHITNEGSQNRPHIVYQIPMCLQPIAPVQPKIEPINYGNGNTCNCNNNNGYQHNTGFINTVENKPSPAFNNDNFGKYSGRPDIINNQFPALYETPKAEYIPSNPNTSSGYASEKDLNTTSNNTGPSNETVVPIETYPILPITDQTQNSSQPSNPTDRDLHIQPQNQELKPSETHQYNNNFNSAPIPNSMNGYGNTMENNMFGPSMENNKYQSNQNNNYGPQINSQYNSAYADGSMNRPQIDHYLHEQNGYGAYGTAPISKDFKPTYDSSMPAHDSPKHVAYDTPTYAEIKYPEHPYHQNMDQYKPKDYYDNHVEELKMYPTVNSQNYNAPHEAPITQDYKPKYNPNMPSNTYSAPPSAQEYKPKYEYNIPEYDTHASGTYSENSYQQKKEEYQPMNEHYNHGEEEKLYPNANAKPESYKAHPSVSAPQEYKPKYDSHTASDPQKPAAHSSGTYQENSYQHNKEEYKSKNEYDNHMEGPKSYPSHGSQSYDARPAAPAPQEYKAKYDIESMPASGHYQGNSNQQNKEEFKPKNEYVNHAEEQKSYPTANSQSYDRQPSDPPPQEYKPIYGAHKTESMPASDAYPVNSYEQNNEEYKPKNEYGNHVEGYKSYPTANSQSYDHQHSAPATQEYKPTYGTQKANSVTVSGIYTTNAYHPNKEENKQKNEYVNHMEKQKPYPSANSQSYEHQSLAPAPQENKPTYGAQKTEPMTSSGVYPVKTYEQYKEEYKPKNEYGSHVDEHKSHPTANSQSYDHPPLAPAPQEYKPTYGAQKTEPMPAFDAYSVNLYEHNKEEYKPNNEYGNHMEEPKSYPTANAESYGAQPAAPAPQKYKTTYDGHKLESAPASVAYPVNSHQHNKEEYKPNNEYGNHVEEQKSYPTANAQSYGLQPAAPALAPQEYKPTGPQKSESVPASGAYPVNSYLQNKEEYKPKNEYDNYEEEHKSTANAQRYGHQPSATAPQEYKPIYGAQKTEPMPVSGAYPVNSYEHNKGEYKQKNEYVNHAEEQKSYSTANSQSYDHQPSVPAPQEYKQTHGAQKTESMPASGAYPINSYQQNKEEYKPKNEYEHHEEEPKLYPTANAQSYGSQPLAPAAQEYKPTYGAQKFDSITVSGVYTISDYQPNKEEYKLNNKYGNHMEEQKSYPTANAHSYVPLPLAPAPQEYNSTYGDHKSESVPASDAYPVNSYQQNKEEYKPKNEYGHHEEEPKLYPTANAQSYGAQQTVPAPQEYKPKYEPHAATYDAQKSESTPASSSYPINYEHNKVEYKPNNKYGNHGEEQISYPTANAQSYDSAPAVPAPQEYKPKYESHIAAYDAPKPEVAPAHITYPEDSYQQKKEEYKPKNEYGNHEEYNKVYPTDTVNPHSYGAQPSILAPQEETPKYESHGAAYETQKSEVAPASDVYPENVYEPKKEENKPKNEYDNHVEEQKYETANENSNSYSVQPSATKPQEYKPSDETHISSYETQKPEVVPSPETYAENAQQDKEEYKPVNEYTNHVEEHKSYPTDKDNTPSYGAQPTVVVPQEYESKHYTYAPSYESHKSQLAPVAVNPDNSYQIKKDGYKPNIEHSSYHNGHKVPIYHEKTDYEPELDYQHDGSKHNYQKHPIIPQYNYQYKPENQQLVDQNKPVYSQYGTQHVEKVPVKQYSGKMDYGLPKQIHFLIPDTELQHLHPENNQYEQQYNYEQDQTHPQPKPAYHSMPQQMPKYQENEYDQPHEEMTYPHMKQQQYPQQGIQHTYHDKPVNHVEENMHEQQNYQLYEPIGPNNGQENSYMPQDLYQEENSYEDFPSEPQSYDAHSRKKRSVDNMAKNEWLQFATNSLQSLKDEVSRIKNQKVNNELEPSNARSSGYDKKKYHSKSYKHNYYLPSLTLGKKSKKLKKFDKLFLKIAKFVIHKLGLLVPYVVEKFFGLGLSYDEDDGYGKGYGGSGNNYAADFSQYGIAGLIPSIILKLLSKLQYLVNALQQNPFLKNFFVPALLLLVVNGAVLFLIWWLFPQTYYSNDVSYPSYSQNNGYDSAPISYY